MYPRWICKFVADIETDAESINGYKFRSGIYIQNPDLDGTLTPLYLFLDRDNSQGGTNVQKLHLFACKTVPKSCIQARSLVCCIVARRRLGIFTPLP